MSKGCHGNKAIILNLIKLTTNKFLKANASSMIIKDDDL